ncbi:oligosaccharide flippase family protein [Colwelliaceae bacterium 6441]
MTSNVDKGKANWLSNFFSRDIKTLISATMVILLFKVIGAVCGFLLSILITRHLAVGEVGTYFFILSIVAIIASLTRCGVDNAITREVARYAKINKFDSIRCVYSCVIKLIGIVSVLVGGCLLVFNKPFITLLNISQNINFYYLMFLPFLTALLAIHIQFFQGLRKTSTYAVLNLLVRPIQLILLLLFVFISSVLTIQLVLFSQILALSITLLLAFFGLQHVISQKDNSVTENGNTTKVKTDLYSLLPSMWFASLFVIVMEQAGQFLVGVLSSPQESALYGVAVRIAVIVSFVVMAFNNAISPIYAQLYAEGKISVLRNLYIKETLIRIMIIIPMLFLVLYFARDILLFFGEEYLAAETVLLWLVIGKMINTIVGPTGTLLMMSEQHSAQRNNLLLSAVILIVACFYLVPLSGAIGAAQAVCFSVILNNIFGLYQITQSVFRKS